MSSNLLKYWRLYGLAFFLSAFPTVLTAQTDLDCTTAPPTIQVGVGITNQSGTLAQVISSPPFVATVSRTDAFGSASATADAPNGTITNSTQAAPTDTFGFSNNGFIGDCFVISGLPVGSPVTATLRVRYSGNVSGLAFELMTVDGPFFPSIQECAGVGCATGGSGPFDTTISQAINVSAGEIFLIIFRKFQSSSPLGGETATTSIAYNFDLPPGTIIQSVAGFGANPVPVLTSLTPSSTLAGEAGFTLTVSGSDFVPGSIVRWNGADRTTTLLSSTQLEALIPASDIATGSTSQVAVFNPPPGGGTSNTLTFTVNNPAPFVTGSLPDTIPAGTSDFILSVKGSGFVPGSIVRWNGSNRATNFVSSGELQASIPASDVALPGTAELKVFNPAPGGGISNGFLFTISIRSPQPIVSALSPTGVVAGGAGFSLAVSGSHFVFNSVVRWNGSDRPTTFLSETQLQASILGSDIASAGTAEVTVFNPELSGGTSNALAFAISTTPHEFPTITSILPDSATVRAVRTGLTLSVSGNDFKPTSVILWNGSERTTTFVNDNQLQASIPDTDLQVAANFLVTVFTPDPGGGISNSITFTVKNPMPTLSSLSPPGAAPGQGGFTLTVKGSNFVPGSIVRWDGSDRTTTFVSSTKLLATIGAGEITNSGEAVVTVFNPGPGGGTSSALVFIINPGHHPIPFIFTISPESAIIGDPGFTLSVNGDGFIPASVVRWNRSDRPTTFVNSSLLQSSIPAEDIVRPGGAVEVTVFNPPPGGGTSNAVSFMINPAPPPSPPPSFSISTSPSTSERNPLPVRIGTGGASITVTVVGQTNFVGTVNLSISGLPVGVLANPATWSLAAGSSQDVTFTATSNASTGASQITISGTSGSLSASADVFLEIEAFLSGEIGPAGGSLAVTDPSSPLFGLELEIPPGALSQATNIEMNPLVDIQTVQTSSSTVVMGWGVDLNPDGLVLNSLATLRIPYPDSNRDGIVDDTNAEAEFLHIGVLESGASNWFWLPATVNTSRRTIETLIDSFSNVRFWYWRFKRGGRVRYRIDRYPSQTSCSSCSPGSIQESLARAIYAWAKHLKLADLTFTEVSTGQAAEIVFQWKSHFLLSQNRPAVTTWAPIFQFEYDVFFNEDLLSGWTTDSTGELTKWNVQAIATHELGHVFGLFFSLSNPGGHFFWGPSSFQPPVMAAAGKEGRRFFDLFPADLTPLYRSYGMSRPTEFAYVTNQASIIPGDPNSVTVIQLIDNSVLGLIHLPFTATNGPQGIAHVDDRGKGYVAVFDAGTLVPIKLVGNTQQPLPPVVNVGLGTNEIAISPDGSTAYVTSSISNTVSAIRLSDHCTDPSLPSCPTPISIAAPSSVAVTPDGKQVLVTSLTGNLAIIDFSTNSVASVSVGQSPEAVAIEPNGIFAYTVDAGSDQVSKINIATRTRVATVGVGSNPLGIALLFPSDGSSPRAYVSNFFGRSVSVIDLIQFDLDPSKAVTTISGLTNPTGMALTPDGKRLYVAEFGANQVRVIDTSKNTLGPTPITGPTPIPGTEIQQPVGITISSHPVPAALDFALDALSVQGNVSPAFFDPFDDGSLNALPTVRLSFTQGMSGTDESGGFLNLRSRDGAEITGRFLRDTATVVDPLTKGGGDSIASAIFRADVPQPGQVYCLGVATPGTLPTREATQICVAGTPQGPVVLAADQSSSLGSFADPNFPTASRITLRLLISDSQGTVMPSYDLDGIPSSNTFNAGTIFTQDTSFFVFVQGAVLLPFIDGQQTGSSSSLTGTLPSSLMIFQDSVPLLLPPPPDVQQLRQPSPGTRRR